MEKVNLFEPGKLGLKPAAKVALGERRVCFEFGCHGEFEDEKDWIIFICLLVEMSEVKMKKKKKDLFLFLGFNLFYLLN